MQSFGLASASAPTTVCMAQIQVDGAYEKSVYYDDKE